ncbi:3167_t:CDS:2 [Funneliformis geosporum]|uniref:3167_t:CDS:1 n=1 Tax=Funneliformis geosporum TaxID=1117311 RepID=A0A9W4SR29_9GLOM|nr:3167_t:CDS:2 [Funneliformis geosporum]
MNKPLSFIFFLIILINVASVPATAQNNDKRLIVKLPTSNVTNLKACPFPMISLNSEEGMPQNDNSLCRDGCCLSCPIVNNFYKKGQIDLIYRTLSVIRLISFICVLMLVVSYIVLPNKRENPALTVLCFNISLLIFLGVSFFYFGDFKRIQCVDPITQSTMKNNTLCGVQGIILIFSTFLLILWCFLLILHLHFQTVWNSTFLQKYYKITQAIILFISIVFAILPAIMNKIKFEFGAVCLVSSESSNELFWYPLAVFVIPGFIIHIWTFVHIGKSQCLLNSDFEDSTLVEENSETSKGRSITEITGSEIVRAVKVQWRALMLALIFLITYMIYWSYYIFEIHRKLQPDTFIKSWFIKWLNCIIENGTKNDAQNICSVYAVDHVPSVAYLATAESLTALLGVSIFIVFGTSVGLWSEWKLYFMKKLGAFETFSNNFDSTWDPMILRYLVKLLNNENVLADLYRKRKPSGKNKSTIMKKLFQELYIKVSGETLQFEPTSELNEWTQLISSINFLNLYKEIIEAGNVSKKTAQKVN